MLEEFNIATAWTPAPEDLDKEIDEAKKEANEVSEKLKDTDSLLNKSLEDGYIDANEKEALNKALDALNAEFNDIKKEYEDVCNYLTSAQKKALEDVYKDLGTKHTKYVSAIKAITNIKIEGLSLVKPKIQISGWSDTNYKTPKSEYESALTAYLSALSTAQTQMRENLDAKTKKNINEAIDNIQVGGVNLIPFYDIIPYNITVSKARPKFILTYTESMGGLKIPATYIRLNTDYVLSFTSSNCKPSELSRLSLKFSNTFPFLIWLNPRISPTVYCKCCDPSLGFTIENCLYPGFDTLLLVT
jgi:hypothetical protein